MPGRTERVLAVHSRQAQKRDAIHSEHKGLESLIDDLEMIDSIGEVCLRGRNVCHSQQRVDIAQVDLPKLKNVGRRRMQILEIERCIS